MEPIKMKKEPKRLWLRALRSGKYKQGTGALYQESKADGKIGYCCLGVLTKEYCKDTGVNFKKVIARSGNGFLPSSVMKWAGIDEKDPYIGIFRASDLNDNQHRPFKTIAKLVEKYL